MRSAVNHKWYQSLLTPQTFLYLMAGVVATVLFWYRTQESWAKVKELEEKVNAQYQRQREMNDGIKVEIQEIRDYMKFQEGYNKAQKEIKP